MGFPDYDSFGHLLKNELRTSRTAKDKNIGKINIFTTYQIMILSGDCSKYKTRTIVH